MAKKRDKKKGSRTSQAGNTSETTQPVRPQAVNPEPRITSESLNDHPTELGSRCPSDKNPWAPESGCWIHTAHWKWGWASTRASQRLREFAATLPIALLWHWACRR